MSDLPLVGTPAHTSEGRSVAAAPRAKNRKVRRLTGRDRIVLGVMVAIPTLIQLVLVWIPTLLPVALSFTKWNGLALNNIKSAGFSNYSFITQT